MALAGVKGLLGAGWKAMLRRRLRHTITVVRAGATNDYGRPTDGATFDAHCLIDGTRTRQLVPGNDDTIVSFTVDFPPNLDVRERDVLRNGRDRRGNVLLQEGRVVAIDDADHADRGQVMRTAQVARA